MEAFWYSYRTAANLSRWLDRNHTFPHCPLSEKLGLFTQCGNSDRVEDIRLSCLLAADVADHLLASTLDSLVDGVSRFCTSPEYRLYAVLLFYQLFRQESHRMKFRSSQMKVLDFACGIYQEFSKPPLATVQVALVHNPPTIISEASVVEAVWAGLLELFRVLLPKRKKTLTPIPRSRVCSELEESQILDQKLTQRVVPGLVVDLANHSRLTPTKPVSERLNRIYRLFAALFSQNSKLQTFQQIADAVLSGLESKELDTTVSAACTCISSFAFGSHEAQLYLRSLGTLAKLESACVRAHHTQRSTSKPLLRLLEAYLNAGFLLPEPFSVKDIKRIFECVSKRCDTAKDLLKLGNIATTLLYKLNAEEEWEELLPVYVTSCFLPLARLEVERNAIEEEAEDSSALWPMALGGTSGDALAARVFQVASLHENFLSKWTLQYWLGDDGRSMANDDQSVSDNAHDIDRVCLAGMSPRFATFCFQENPTAGLGDLQMFVYAKLLQALKDYSKDQNCRSGCKMSFVLRRRFAAWMEKQRKPIDENFVEEWFLQHLDGVFSVAHAHNANEIHESLSNVVRDKIPRDITFQSMHTMNTARVFAIPFEEASVERIADALVSSGYVAEGKLWFHGCFGHKALSILDQPTLWQLGANPPPDLGLRSSFDVYEDITLAIDHHQSVSGGPLCGQAIHLVGKQRCILIFDQGEVDLESMPHMIPTAHDWRTMVFAHRSRTQNIYDYSSERDANGLLVRDYLEKVSVLTDKRSEERNTKVAIRKLEEDLLKIVERQAWIFSWALMRGTHVFPLSPFANVRVDPKQALSSSSSLQLPTALQLEHQQAANPADLRRRHHKMMVDRLAPREDSWARKRLCSDPDLKLQSVPVGRMVWSACELLDAMHGRLRAVVFLL